MALLTLCFVAVIALGGAHSAQAQPGIARRALQRTAGYVARSHTVGASNQVAVVREVSAKHALRAADHTDRDPSPLPAKLPNLDHPSANMIFNLAAKNTSRATMESNRCTCAFSGMCDPHHAMDFMRCMSTSCGSTACQCEGNAYLLACQALSTACADTDLVMKCTGSKAEAHVKAIVKHHQNEPTTTTTTTTTSIAPAAITSTAPTTIGTAHPLARAHRGSSKPADAISHVSSFRTTFTTTYDPVEMLYSNLKELKQQDCKAKAGIQRGLLNADNRRLRLAREIKAGIGDLERRCQKIPEMHCEKDFEEFTPPPPPCRVQIRNAFTKKAFHKPQPARSSCPRASAWSALVLGIAATFIRR